MLRRDKLSIVSSNSKSVTLRIEASSSDDMAVVESKSSFMSF